MIKEPTHIIYYDGECGFCNQSVQWILKHDTKHAFHFAALQSNLAQERMKKYRITIQMNTILVESKHNIYQKSDAILHILYILGGYWRILSYAKVLPRRIRDSFYDLIARNRHRILGKKQQCLLPTPTQKAQFLDQ